MRNCYSPGALSDTEAAQKRLYLSLDLFTVMENVNDPIESLKIRNEHLSHHLRIDSGRQLSAFPGGSSRSRKRSKKAVMPSTTYRFNER